MQQTTSQTTDINLQNSSIAVDSLKTIEIARGLKNEAALKEYVSSLELLLHQKDSIIILLLTRGSAHLDNLTTVLNREQKSIQQLSDLSAALTSIYKKIEHLNQESAEVHQERDRKGLYLGTEIGTGYDIKYKHIFFNLQYVSKRWIYGIKVNPVNSYIVYAGSISFKIF